MGGQPKILIIDDDPAIRETVEAMLILGGYSVKTASNQRKIRNCYEVRLLS